MKIQLYYDNECPFCREYSKFVNIKKKIHITLHNARDEKKAINNFRKKGFDINTGMILLINDKDIYHGAKAGIKLDQLIDKTTFFDNFISFTVNLKIFAPIIYPTVKLFRNIILRLSGKNPNINH